MNDELRALYREVTERTNGGNVEGITALLVEIQCLRARLAEAEARGREYFDQLLFEHLQKKFGADDATGSQGQPGG